MSKRKLETLQTMQDVALLSFRVVPLVKSKFMKVDNFVSSRDLSLAQIQILLMLDETKILTIAQINAKLDIAKPNITPLVDALISKGFVDRKRDAIDKRRVHIIILPRGEAEVESIKVDILQQIEQTTSQISDRDFKSLLKAFRVIESLLRER